MDIVIREAKATDWPGVAELLAELGRPDVRGEKGEETHRALFASYLEREDVEAMVAELEDEIVGFVNIEYRTRLNRELPEGWIPELIVAEHVRSRGIGKDLLGRAEAAARSRGCWGIALESATWRKAAHRFYEREGWAHTANAFDKDLLN